ncbi:MAG: FHA domain-containing protein [Planctomycetota bacterium]|nr:FHA domain-containing protein [Planctomycetota bacterium]
MAHLWVNTSRTSERKNLRRPVVAGSAASNAIVIDDPAASHHTFKIAFDNAGWFVEDLADRLTVKVNGVPVFRRYLEDGDEICVGDTALVFHDDAEPEEALFAFDDGVFPVELEELSQLGPFYERRLIQLAYGTRKLKRTVISICVLSVLFSAAVLWFAFHQARLAEVGGAKDSKGGQVDVLSQVADSHTRKASGVSLEEALARYPLARDIPRRLFESTLGALVAEAEESHAEYEEACKAAEILAGSREYYGAYSRMMKFVNRFPSSSRALSAVQLATRYRSTQASSQFVLQEGQTSQGCLLRVLRPRCGPFDAGSERKMGAQGRGDGCDGNRGRARSARPARQLLRQLADDVRRTEARFGSRFHWARIG